MSETQRQLIEGQPVLVMIDVQGGEPGDGKPRENASFAWFVDKKNVKREFWRANPSETF